MQYLTKEQTIHKILTNFDFERVHKTMQALDWKWVSSNGVKAPTQVELVLKAQSLLHAVYDSLVQDHGTRDYSKHATGGFAATATFCPEEREIVLELEFIVANWNHSDKDNCY